MLRIHGEDPQVKNSRSKAAFAFDDDVLFLLLIGIRILSLPLSEQFSIAPLFLSGNCNGSYHCHLTFSSITASYELVLVLLYAMYIYILHCIS